jgi:hypothetical protein
VSSRGRALFTLCLVTGVAVSWHAGAAFAHALAERYELPLPLGLYLGAAGFVVAVSFLLLATFARQPSSAAAPLVVPYLILGKPGRWACLPLRIFGVAMFLVIIAAGLFGFQSPFKNIAPVMVWVVWWVGLSILSALVVNLWPALNPWTAIYDAVARLGRWASGSPKLGYPQRLGAWPAAFFMLAFLWMELAWDGAEWPRTLAVAILLYSAVTWAGMILFGREAWLRNGEVFSVFFALFGRFAPFAAEPARDPVLILRPYGAGLLEGRPVHPSTAAFVIVVLSAVTADGFLETPLWERWTHALLDSEATIPVWSALAALGVDAVLALTTLAILLFPLIFLAAFGLTSSAVAALAGSAAPDELRRTGTILRLFVLTLVPIAIAYHVAHYLTYFLLAGQFIIPLASDPFGSGADLFGTKLYRIDIGVINAAATWWVSVAAIVLGHVAAVVLAHRTAIAAYGDVRAANRSQWPLMALMVAYTMSSLWILAQPVVK